MVPLGLLYQIKIHVCVIRKYDFRRKFQMRYKHLETSILVSGWFVRHRVGMLDQDKDFDMNNDLRKKNAGKSLWKLNLRSGFVFNFKFMDLELYHVFVCALSPFLRDETDQSEMTNIIMDFPFRLYRGLWWCTTCKNFVQQERLGINSNGGTTSSVFRWVVRAFSAHNYL